MSGLARGIDDILEEFGPLFETAVSPDCDGTEKPAERSLDATEREVREV